MHFIGLAPSTLLAVGIAAALAIVGLYLLKLRKRTVAVPFAKLWGAAIGERDATTLFSQLQRLLSLLLQLALLALLLVALGDPRATGVRTSGRSVVVLVDTSASMKATDVSTPLAPHKTRLDVAKDEVRRLVRGLGPADRMLVARMDAGVAALSTLTSDLLELDAAADKLAASDTRADFPRALRFALDVLRGLPSPEIVVVSDGNVGPPHDALGDVKLGGAKLAYVPIGKRGRNVAITELTVRRYPLDRDRYEVMLALYNASSEAQTVELTLLGDGTVIDVTKLALEPGEKLPRFYANLAGARHSLEAVIKLAGGEADDLPADDHAYALLPEQRRIQALCVTAGNTYLEAALLLTSYVDVTYVTTKQYPPPRGAHFDVTIFDGVAPPVFDGAGDLFYLDPSGPYSPVGAGTTELKQVGFDTIDKKSPLLRWTAIDDVYVGKARKLEPRPGDRVVGASEKGALLVHGRREGHRFVALGFDPRSSDLVLRIAWPVLVMNVLNDLVAEDTAYLSSFRTGEPWRIPLAAAADEATVIDPLGGRHLVPVQDGRAVFAGEHTGFYAVEVAAAGGGAPSRAEFAANLSDLDESAITPQPTLTVDGVEAGKVGGFVPGLRSEWWMLLLFVAILLTTIEWATYHRRITV